MDQIHLLDKTSSTRKKFFTLQTLLKTITNNNFPLLFPSPTKHPFISIANAITFHDPPILSLLHPNLDKPDIRNSSIVKGKRD